MPKTTGRILKASDVQFEGVFKLELSPTVASTAAPTNTGTVPQKITMVENTPEFALVEVTCSCGTKTLVRCEYAPGQAPAQAAPAE